MHDVLVDSRSRFQTIRAVDKRIGERLRTVRLLKDMSQEHLSDLLGIAHGQVQKYEDGSKRISASRLIRISHVMEIPLHQLIGTEIDDPESNRTALDNPLAVSEAVELLKAFRVVTNPLARRILIDMAGILSER
jgi:transcriptional regulator with XRE-family HTH domain